MIKRLNDTHYDITGLMAGTLYNVSITSSNMAGNVTSNMLINTSNTSGK